MPSHSRHTAYRPVSASFELTVEDGDGKRTTTRMNLQAEPGTDISRASLEMEHHMDEDLSGPFVRVQPSGLHDVTLRLLRFRVVDPPAEPEQICVPTAVDGVDCSEHPHVPGEATLDELAAAPYVIDRDHEVWRVVRDGGMVAKTTKHGEFRSAGILWLKNNHGPLTAFDPRRPR